MRKLIYTFSSILFLLAVFLGLWWQQAYVKKESTLRDSVEREANRMVAEDFVMGTLQAMMMRRGELRPDVIIKTGEKVGRQAVVYRILNIYRNQYGIPRNAEILIYHGDEAVAKSHYLFEDRKISLDRLPRMIHDSLEQQFGITLESIGPKYTMPKYQRLPLEVRVRYVESENTLSKHSYLMIGSRRPILLSMLPEFLFGLILFCATAFAFLSTFRALQEQERQLAQKDALVANVAHELKTPIATVGVALEALNTFGADVDPARRREYLQIGNAELARLDQMADRAIDALADGDLAQRLRRTPTAVAQAVNDAWRGLSLRYDLPDDALELQTHGSGTANVDAHYWHHLVYNLLDNACKYGARPLAIDVSLSVHEGDLLLTVADNGPGIPPHERDNVFERFYRVTDKARGHRVKGHGLGLTFVRQVAEAHGGSVEIDRGALGGACFKVRLPG